MSIAMVEDVWAGLYGESWKGLICDEAFAHPAKFSRALIRKIYDHVIEEGWATGKQSIKASENLVKYLQCHVDINPVRIVVSPPDTPGALSAPVSQSGGPSEKVGTLDRVSNAVPSSVQSNQSQSNFVPGDASLTAGTPASSSVAKHAGKRSVVGRTDQESFAPERVTSKRLSATNTRPGNRDRECSSKAILASAESPTGNGGAESTSNTTARSGKLSARQSEKRSATANGAELPIDSRSTTRSHSDIHVTTLERTSRSYALRVTDELINCLIESSQSSAQSGSLRQLKHGQAITLSLPDGLRSGDIVTVEGSTVVDPFGGVALGAFDAMRHGLNWYGCELEAKFVGLGGQNIALWNERFSRMPNWGTARLLQGDSRKLAAVLSAGDCCVSSPPYIDSLSTVKADVDDKMIAAKQSGTTAQRATWGANKGSAGWSGDEYGNSEGQLGAMKEGDYSLAVTSPPWEVSADAQRTCTEDGTRARQATSERGTYAKKYGDADGQLGQMVITSPPYIESLKPETEDQTRKKQERIARSKTLYDGRKTEKPSPGKAALGGGYGITEGNLAAMPEGQLCVTSPPYNLPFSQDHNGSRGGGRSNGTAPSSERGAFIVYGNTPGQLEGMRGDGFEAAISSPPYEGIRQDGGRIALEGAGGFGAYTDESPDTWHTQRDQNNIGNLKTGETFWSASRLILEQLRQVMVPGGHAVFVVKAFVRDKQIVDFPAQWAQLCEAVGFRLLHHHRASLVESGAQQPAMDQFDVQGDTWRMVTRDKDYSVARKSFFRRLAEKKGSPRIDHESVLCFERP